MTIILYAFPVVAYLTDMNRSVLNKIISKVEKEEEIFADKSVLSTLSLPEKIVGRKKQAEELSDFYLDTKKDLLFL